MPLIPYHFLLYYSIVVVILDTHCWIDIIENMLYILWRHLQYYLVHCKPVDPDISLGVQGIDRSGPRRLQGKHISLSLLILLFGLLMYI